MADGARQGGASPCGRFFPLSSLGEMSKEDAFLLALLLRDLRRAIQEEAPPDDAVQFADTLLELLRCAEAGGGAGADASTA